MDFNIKSLKQYEMHASISIATLLALPTVHALVRDGGIVCFCALPISTLIVTLIQGKLPALGWNSWNAFNCDVNETKIVTAANEIINLGLKDAGYEYVNSSPLFYL